MTICICMCAHTRVYSLAYLARTNRGAYEFRMECYIWNPKFLHAKRSVTKIEKLIFIYHVPGRVFFFFLSHFHLFENHFMGLSCSTEEIMKNERDVLATSHKVWLDYCSFVHRKTDAWRSSSCAQSTEPVTES